MKTLYIIGLTGGIACGKSAVSQTLQKFGATTLDLDEVTRWLSEPGGVLFEIYVRHFGEKILTATGQLDKKKIGEIIFNQPEERMWLNSATHPILLNETRQFLVDCLEADVKFVVLEVPLLFQAGWEILCDEVWAVSLNRSKQINRLMTRDKLTKVQALARINSQMSTAEICSRADVVIKTGKNFSHTHKQIVAALERKNFVM